MTELLLSLTDDSWVQRFRHYDDVTYKLRMHIEARPGLIVTVQYVRDMSSYVQVLHIGEPPAGGA